MILGQIRVAIGDDHLQRALLYRAGHVLEQRDRLPVGPMEVVEHHAQRLRAPHREQQLVDRSEQEEPLGLGIGGLRRGRVRRPAREIAREPRDLAAVRRDVSGEHVVRCMLDQLRADLDPRLVRRRDVLAARTPADREPLRIARRSAACDASRVFPIPGSPDRSTTCRAPARACARERSISARSSARPTYATRGTDRSAAGTRPRPDLRPRTRSASGSHTTANASIGSGIPFSSNSPTDSNRAPSTLPASIFVAGDTRIPSAGALSHNRAASIAGIPK